MNESNKPLTTKEAAKLAGVSDSYIRYMLIDGTLKGWKAGGWMWLVAEGEIRRWMEKRGADN